MPGRYESDAPSVTIVVSAYNEAGSIGECIDSILAQQQPPDRIVVVNDGSSDDTAQILSRYAEDRCIEVINLVQNVGVPAARNVGISECQTDSIAFLDADARAPATWLEDLVKPFADPAVVVTGGPDAFLHGEAMSDARGVGAHAPGHEVHDGGP